ncbi:oxidoreductase [Carboxydothermus islandicus]|uniref:Oxidoreductase n=1 Tax=Carboxydothermus islandicus TaxID=661089 RepID=A0A1L8CZZ1_9THEO|nr:oxidoreductase [Carboxydothermus islandicus]GAV24464.1 oxidoreductase [Carboxydothermus islandicus]
MVDKKIRVGLVGAGKTGTPLLEQLLDADFIEVVGVADVDFGAPGILLAKEKGIFITRDFLDIAKMGKKVDLIIETTGIPEVRQQLRWFMKETGNNHTIIVPELVAILMQSLAAGKLVETYHGYQKYL